MPANNISYFIKQIEHKYNLSISDHHWSIRPVAMLIVHRFTGIYMHDVVRYFKCSTVNVSLGINRQLGYERCNDPLFIKTYHELLQLYIDSSRLFYRRNMFNSKYSQPSQTKL